MKNILYTIILSFLFSSSVFADYQAGRDAYDAGDYATALKEWKALAEQGDVDAQHNLGVMYSQGEGPTQDDKEAVKWYRLAAEQGYVESQFNLGLMYQAGYGVTQDDAGVYKSVDEDGNVTFTDKKSSIDPIKIKSNKSSNSSKKEAFKWFHLAAEQGHGKAQIHVSLMYSNGEGVAVDYVMGYMWLTTTLSNKNQKYDSVLTVQTLRKKLSKLMTSEQKSKALELARFCVRKNYKNCNNSSLSIEKAEALEANAKAKEKELKRKPNKAIDNFHSFKTECIKTKYKSEDCKRQFPDASSNIEKSP